MNSLIKDRNETLDKSEISSLINTISELKNKIFEYQSQLSELEIHQELKSKYFEVSSKRNKVLQKYNSYTNRKQAIPELIKLKANLRKNLVNWLDQLNTLNVNRDISFKLDFVPVFGSDTITALSGSTKTRAVLAYHTALLELMTSYQEYSGFKILILDTPKQHEIHLEDLKEYIIELKKLSKLNDIQIIFSNTEYHYNGDEFDKEWNPNYCTENGNMFLEVL